MLLNIYLVTTAISWATVFIFSVNLGHKLEIEGYKVVKTKKSFIEKLVSFISTVFIGFIPVYNIIKTIALLYMGDECYEYAKDELLKKGKIYMSNDKFVNSESKMELSSIEKEKNNFNSIQKGSTKKKYKDMSIEEKKAYLERERELLIGQKESFNDDSLSENLVQEGTVLKRTFKHKKK